ncbi:hypothetical protein MMC26_004304 [Xylographa opegraphella]|nr:hypothetical protein [Xylographa opegraphella]
MKFLNSILYLLAANLNSIAASTSGDEESVNLYVRDTEVMPSIYARSIIARDLEHIDHLEKRAKGIWERAVAAKKALGTGARHSCSYHNCKDSRGHPDDSVCVDKGCLHCGGTPGHYSCVDYD